MPFADVSSLVVKFSGGGLWGTAETPSRRVLRRLIAVFLPKLALLHKSY